MDTDLLKSFVCICNRGSITKAAQELYMTQSGLSRKISALEKELGIQLLIRTRQGILLTEAGRLFYEDAKTILKAHDSLSFRIQQLKNGLIGRLIIGNCSHEILTPLLEASRKMWVEHPEIDLDMRKIMLSEALPSFLSNQVDLIYGFRMDLPHTSGTATATIVKNRPTALIPLGHKLYNRQHIVIEDLVHESFAIIARGDASQEITFSALEKRGVLFNNSRICDSPSSRLYQIASGRFIGLSGEYSEHLENFSPYMRSIPIMDLELDISDLCAVYDPSNTFAQLFIEYLQKAGSIIMDEKNIH